MAAAQFNQQLLSYMGASMGGFQAPGGTGRGFIRRGFIGGGGEERGGGGGGDDARRRQTPMGYPGMPYGSPPMPGFMPPPWAQAMAPHPPHDDPSRR
jgi:hypothetical protein